jgi:hypothetical protein
MGQAKFTLGTLVTLFATEGAEILARPFFYTDHGGGGLQVELFTEYGDKVQCVDESRGVCLIAGKEAPLIHSSTPRPN